LVGERGSVTTYRKDDQRRVHKGLETEVAMNEFDEFAIARDVTRLVIETKLASRAGATLASNPRIEGDEEALTSSWNPKPLVNRF
jgi:hypothetical protein